MRTRAVRRLLAASLLLVVAVGAPAAAWAAFSAKASGTTRVGTLQLVAPADASGTFSCPSNNGMKNGGVVVTGWTSVNGADSYTLTLDPPGNVSNVTRTVNTPSRQTLTPGSTPGKGTWTFTIVARAGTWTGPAFSQSFSC